MITAFPNVILNGKFDLADYGSTPRTTTGFAMTRWYFEASGTGVSVAPGTTSTNFNLTKWLRGRNCMDITVTAANYSTSDTAIVRQRIEEGDRHGETVARLTVVAFGPAGGSFKFGVAGLTKTLTTLGDTAGGTPQVAYGVLEEAIDPPSTPYLTVEIFKEPVDMDATYKIAFVQLEYRHYGLALPPQPYQLRLPAIERLLCARYLWPLPQWTPCLSTTSQQVIVPVVTPVEMTATPTVVSNATSVDFVQQTNGSVFTSSAPSPSLDATFKSFRGGRLIFAAFNSPSALGSGVAGMIGTYRSALLEAEL